jgi:ribosomal protein S18 acetylase RimI-like enzyme
VAMLIRPLTSADAATWRELRLRMLREHPDAFGSAYEEHADRPVESFAQRLREVNNAPDSFILGAFEGARLVGSVGLRRESGAKDRHKAGIFSVYVAPEARGSGTGRALLTEAIARAHATPDLEQLHLAVTRHSAAARSLYASLGFEPYGLARHALKLADRYIDEELMVLWLRSHPQ